MVALKNKKFGLSNEEKYGGCPRKLPVNALPTYADVARYFYTLSEKTNDFKKQVRIVRKNVWNVWKRCCRHLPLLTTASVYKKLLKFLTHVKKSRRKQVLSYKFKYYEYKKEHLFDIATCSCDLPVVTCDTVNCASVNCQKVHIQCLCPAKRRVPEKLRSYLRSQRARVTSQSEVRKNLYPLCFLN